MTRKDVLAVSIRCDSQPAQAAAPSPRARAGSFRTGSSPAEIWGPGPSLFGNTMLVLKAACQCLGYYPPKNPSKTEIRVMLREMERMHGDWKKGIGATSMGFGNVDGAIRQIEKYAEYHGILPA